MIFYTVGVNIHLSDFFKVSDTVSQEIKTCYCNQAALALY